MKKYLKLMVFFLLLFVTGCKNKVEKIKNGIEIQYIENDNALSVTKSFYVPLEVDGYEITWVTGSPYLKIDGDRIVIKPTTTDTNATLSASFVYKEETHNVHFIITLIGVDEEDTPFDVDAIKNQINIPTETMSDIFLPTLIDGVTITWVSSDENVISNTGIVTPQNEDVVVNLRATFETLDNGTLLGETVVGYFVTVLGKDSGSFDFTEIINQIEIPTETSADIFLPTQIDDVTITWVSSNESIISNTGVILRPNEDTFVSLIAKLKKGSSEKNVLYTVTILGKEDETFDFTDVINQINIPTETSANIFLPTLIDDVTITWVSSNESVISNTGVVVRPNENTIVNLIAKLKKDAHEENVLYTITVLKKVDSPIIDIVFEGYYASLSGLQGEALKNALKTLIKNTGRATGTTAQVKQADAWNGSYYLIYTGMGPYGNREHTWPKSLLGSAPIDDLHNLRACNSNVNSSRGNLPFREDGKPFTGNQPYGRFNGGWYPGDEHIGDVARIVLYLHVRYGININSVGNLNMFLEWHELDPVNDFERTRNGRIEGIQGNRNPFIDYPELVAFYFSSNPTSFYVPLSLISATLRMNDHYNRLIS